MSDLRDGLDEFDEMENEAKEAATVSAERDVEIVREALEHPDAQGIRKPGALEAFARLTAERGRLVAATDRIDWYVRCLEDVQDGRVVRGLGEAKAGYQSAMDELFALTPQADAAGGDSKADYLQREINVMRRVMQEAGTWDAFCRDYADYKARQADAAGGERA